MQTCMDLLDFVELTINYCSIQYLHMHMCMIHAVKILIRDTMKDDNLPCKGQTIISIPCTKLLTKDDNLCIKNIEYQLCYV